MELGCICSWDTVVGGCRASGLAEDHVIARPLAGADGHSPPPLPGVGLHRLNLG